MEVTYQKSTLTEYGEPLFYHPQILCGSGNLLSSKGDILCHSWHIGVPERRSISSVVNDKRIIQVNFIKEYHFFA